MFKIGLLENAYDYVLDAVRQLRGKNPGKRKIKYAIIHLWSGIGLLLKSRLMQEHWSLIFRDINKADKTALETGSFFSVNFNESISRLKNICNVDIDSHKDILEKIRKDRNRLEHFQIKKSKDTAISNLVTVWGFILDFSVSEIDFSNENRAEKLFREIKEEIIPHEEFIQKRLVEIEPKLKENKDKKYPHTVIDCPECLQDTLFLMGGNCECLFCRERLSWEDAMEKWLILHEGWYNYYDYKERSIYPLTEECPECGEESLYKFEYGGAQPPDPAAICFHCGAEFPFCEWCDLSELCPDDDDGVCRECSTYLKYKDKDYNEGVKS
jgi:hypothetical protein